MQKETEALGILEQGDRKEHGRAEGESDDTDEEWAQPLKEAPEIDVAHGGQSGEGERREKAERFAVS